MNVVNLAECDFFHVKYPARMVNVNVCCFKTYIYTLSLEASQRLFAYFGNGLQTFALIRSYDRVTR